jgi:hypothetical protein
MFAQRFDSLVMICGAAERFEPVCKFSSRLSCYCGSAQEFGCRMRSAVLRTRPVRGQWPGGIETAPSAHQRPRRTEAASSLELPHSKNLPDGCPPFDALSRRSDLSFQFGRAQPVAAEPDRLAALRRPTLSPPRVLAIRRTAKALCTPISIASGGIWTAMSARGGRHPSLRKTQ